MASKNSLSIDYRDLPDLKAALGGLVPGDRCSVCFDLMVTANGDERLEGSVEEVEYEVPSEESEDEESGSVEPTADEPVMVAVVSRNLRKSKKPAAVDEEDGDAEE